MMHEPVKMTGLAVRFVDPRPREGHDRSAAERRH
jgi:hypothetical protein